jgi:hypothetical protein
VKEGRCEWIGYTRQIKALDKRKKQGPTTYVNTINLLLFSLAAEDESVGKETKEDRFGQVHYSFAVNAETLPSKV